MDFAINAQMIVNGNRFTPQSIRTRKGHKPVAIRPKSGIMSLDVDANVHAAGSPGHADAEALGEEERYSTDLQSPSNFVDAAEYGLETAGDEAIDEDAIKESPPKPKRLSSAGSGGHVRQSSEPRPLGEMIDEVERQGAGSPSLRHTRGRLEEKEGWEAGQGSNGNGHALGMLREDSGEHADEKGSFSTPIKRKAVPVSAQVGEGESYADAIKESTTAADGQPNGVNESASVNGGESYAEAVKDNPPAKDNEIVQGNGVPIPALSVYTNGNGVAAKHAMGTRTPETYEAVGEDESPRSPIRKAHKRVSSRSLNGSIRKEQKREAEPQPSLFGKEVDGDAEQGKSDLQRQADTQEPAQPAQPAQSEEQPQPPQQHDPDEQLSPNSQPGSGSVANNLDGQHQEEGQLIYEPLRNKDGENLVSIKPAEDYHLGLQQAESENKSKGTSAPPPDEYEMKLAQQQRRNSLTSGRHAGAGWSRSAIRWAPLNVPLQRRLQTLMVLAHTMSIAGGLALFFLLCTIPLLWPILLPYLLYVLLSRAATSGELSQRSEYLRRSKVWSLFAGYFPARLHRSEKLEPTRKYIFGYHPHGIISHGAFAAFGTEALGFSQLFPGITNTLLTLDSNFRIPLYRDYALRMGLASVSRESCENILSRGGPNNEGMGRAITIVVGGARESLDAKPYTLRLVLKRRKGFVKLAIRTGADLVPCLAFGENDIYEQFDASKHPYVHKAQLLVKKVMGFTIPLFHARGVFNYDVGLMPYRRPINIVVGKPIRIQQAKKPDPAYVDEIHERYVEELMRVWEDWKGTFARHREGEVEVVE